MHINAILEVFFIIAICLHLTLAFMLVLFVSLSEPLRSYYKRFTKKHQSYYRIIENKKQIPKTCFYICFQQIAKTMRGLTKLVCWLANIKKGLKSKKKNPPKADKKRAIENITELYKNWIKKRHFTKKIR